MNKDELKSVEKDLKEGSFIDNDDELIVTEKGDYWEKILFFRTQTRGYYYFTKKAIIFLGGFASSTQLVIPYKNIQTITKCSVGPFLPFGIMVEVFDEKKMKNVKYKLSLQHRDKWIEFIEEKRKG